MTTIPTTETARWWLGALAVIKLDRAATGGALSILEVTEGPGAQAPLHVHHEMDETFCVLDGGATFVLGADTITASAGDVVHGPRGVPHRYVAGSEGCRLLFVCTPGGFEDLVVRLSEPAPEAVLPPPLEVEPDWEHVAQVAAAHGCEVLG